MMDSRSMRFGRCLQGQPRAGVARHVSQSYAVRLISEVPVTQQYLIGEFSALLEELQPSPGDCLAAAVHDLRREVECSSLKMLPQLAREAMGLSDVICWTALERGDAAGFYRYAKAAVALGDFTDAAGLLPE